jgi:hypothetical protein
MAAEQKIYAVAKWRETFETSDSRKHKALCWVSVPNNMASNGYVEMISHFGREEAPAIYGAWIALVLIASKCPARGVLCTSSAVGLSVDRLSFLSHFGSSVFQKLLPWAESVGWLEVLSFDQAKATLEGGLSDQKTADRLPNDNQPVVTRLATGLQTRPNLTKPNPTRQTAQKRLTDGSMDGGKLNLDWGRQDLEREAALFRKRTGVTQRSLPSDYLIPLVAFGLSTGNGFLGDLATGYAKASVTKPKKYCDAATRNYCDEHHLDREHVTAAVQLRLESINEGEA